MLTFLPRCLTLAFCLGLAACASQPLVQHYDFGLPASAHTAAPAVLLAPIQPQAALDGTAIWYRLASSQHILAYRDVRWSMPPAQLLELHLRQRWAQAKPHTNLQLRLELDEFSQVFDSAQQSRAHLSVRATLVRDQQVQARTSFNLSSPANTADAQGGIIAMRNASVAFALALETWLAEQTPHASPR